VCLFVGFCGKDDFLKEVVVDCIADSSCCSFNNVFLVKLVFISQERRFFLSILIRENVCQLIDVSLFALMCSINCLILAEHRRLSERCNRWLFIGANGQLSTSMELSAAASSSLSYQSQEKLGLVIWKTSIIVLRTCVWQRGKQSKQSTQKSGPGGDV